MLQGLFKLTAGSALPSAEKKPAFVTADIGIARNGEDFLLHSARATRLANGTSWRIDYYRHDFSETPVERKKGKRIGYPNEMKIVVGRPKLSGSEVVSLDRMIDIFEHGQKHRQVQMDKRTHFSTHREALYKEADRRMPMADAPFEADLQDIPDSADNPFLPADIRFSTETDIFHEMPWSYSDPSRIDGFYKGKFRVERVWCEVQVEHVAGQLRKRRCLVADRLEGEDKWRMFYYDECKGETPSRPKAWRGMNLAFTTEQMMADMEYARRQTRLKSDDPMHFTNARIPLALNMPKYNGLLYEGFGSRRHPYVWGEANTARLGEALIAQFKAPPLLPPIGASKDEGCGSTMKTVPPFSVAVRGKSRQDKTVFERLF